MKCPVVVANEVSGLTGRAAIRFHLKRRNQTDGTISGSSLGADHESTRSDFASRQRQDLVDAGSRDSRHLRYWLMIFLKAFPKEATHPLV